MDESWISKTGRGNKMKKNLWGILTLLVLLLTWSACASSTSSTASTSTTTPAEKPASAPAANLDVCALVTAQEMSEIVGGTVTAQPRTLQTGIPACSYKSTAGNPVPGATIAVHKPNGVATYKSAQGSYKSSKGYQEVTGIGEQAFDSADGAFYALKGDTCLDVVLAQNPDIRFAQLKRIATLAIGRM
jgi:hypothetical protein